MNLSDPIVESVVTQLRQRAEIGFKKYGTDLTREDVSFLGWIQHLQEELMDAVNYIERIKREYTNASK